MVMSKAQRGLYKISAYAVFLVVLRAHRHCVYCNVFLVCLQKVSVLYLNLDLILELLKVSHELPGSRVSHSQHNLQACPTSCSSSHHHAKAVLWLELYVCLKETRTIMVIAKIVASNQIKRQEWWGSRDDAQADKKLETRQMLVFNRTVMQGQHILRQSNKRIEETAGAKNRNNSVTESLYDIKYKSKKEWWCRVPRSVLTWHPGCLSWWWTSGRSAQVKHCRRRRVFDC